MVSYIAHKYIQAAASIATGGTPTYELIKYAPDMTPSTVTNTEYESTLSHMSPIDFNTNPLQLTFAIWISPRPDQTIGKVNQQITFR